MAGGRLAPVCKCNNASINNERRKRGGGKLNT